MEHDHKIKPAEASNSTGFILFYNHSFSIKESENIN